MLTVMAGPHDHGGRPLYRSWPWDPGIASAGWRQWKLGDALGVSPSRNVTLGSGSLAMVFSTPPTILPAGPQRLFEFELRFDFDRDAPKIYATDAQFPHSAWSDISARSTDLGVFRRHGGRLLLTQGVADPVFSINDTIAWLDDVNAANRGQADRFVRLFAVPGMNHCRGGDATDQFDVLAPLVAWVERQRPPTRLSARANPASPWPRRTRPLCAYPSVARYAGRGDPEQARSFSCGI